MLRGFPVGIPPLADTPEFAGPLFRDNHPTARAPGPAAAIDADFADAIERGRVVVHGAQSRPWTQADLRTWAARSGRVGAMTEPLHTVPKGAAFGSSKTGHSTAPSRGRASTLGSWAECG
jgi:hypothetical protein